MVKVLVRFITGYTTAQGSGQCRMAVYMYSQYSCVVIYYTLIPHLC